MLRLRSNNQRRPTLLVIGALLWLALSSCHTGHQQGPRIQDQQLQDPQQQGEQQDGQAPQDLTARLLTVHPNGPARAADLQTLSQWLDGARVVGLGETEHGVEDFHRLAHRLFAGLAANAGFQVFAWEINAAHARLLDQWVTGGDGDLDSLLALHAWPSRVFYSPALRQLLVWMRQHNRTAERPVRLAGYDFKDPSLAMTSVVEQLAEIDPTTAQRAATVYAEYKDLPGLGVIPNISGFSAVADLGLPANRPESTILTFSIEARAEGFTRGSVGLWAGHELVYSPEQLGADWQRLQLEIEVPTTATNQPVTIYHRGNGTLWLRQPRARLGDLELAVPQVEVLRPRPLALPRLQVMDHRWRVEPSTEPAVGATLRIDFDRTLDRALEDIDRLDQQVIASIEANVDRMTPEQALWLRQASRWVVQAYEWRCLEQWNRDVLMAENARWLAEQAFPSSRLVLFGHSSHTERQPGRMGELLGHHWQQRYRTVSLLALAGERYYIDSQNIREMGSDPQFVLSPLVRGDRSVERVLGRLAPSDLMFHWRAAKTLPADADILAPARLPPSGGADVMILLRHARAHTVDPSP